MDGGWGRNRYVLWMVSGVVTGKFYGWWLG